MQPPVSRYQNDHLFGANGPAERLVSLRFKKYRPGKEVLVHLTTLLET